MQDVLSRYAVLVPIKDCSATTAARVLCDRWVCSVDIPKVVQSDRGPHFTAAVFETVCRQLGVRQALSSPGHAKSNAQVERQNQLIDHVRCVCGRKPNDWPRALAAVQYAHNTAANATTGVSPYYLMYQRQPNRPEELMIPADPDEVQDTRRSQVQEMDTVFRLVKKRVKERQQKTASRRQPTPGAQFSVGDRVRLRLVPSQRRGLGTKLALYKSEPYMVIRRSNNTHWVKPVRGGRILQRHFEELERAPVQLLAH